MYQRKTSKYHAIKTYSANGVLCDSKKEAKRYNTLLLMQRAGLIANLQRQVPFVLQPGFVSNVGKKEREITYVADFVYYDVEKKANVIEDTKSPATRTPVYAVKRKLLLYKYPEYLFVES